MSTLKLTVNNNFILNKKLSNGENQSKQLKLNISDSQAASVSNYLNLWIFLYLEID